MAAAPVLEGEIRQIRNIQIYYLKQKRNSQAQQLMHLEHTCRRSLIKVDAQEVVITSLYHVP
jgi:hypothetical protein